MDLVAAGVKVFLHLSLPQLSLQHALLHDRCRTALLVEALRLRDDEHKHLAISFLKNKGPRQRLCSPGDTPLKQEHAARLEERNWAAVGRRRKKASGSLMDQKRENPVNHSYIKGVAPK